MTENMAGRGEGLAGLAKGWLQVCDKIMAGKGAAKADAEDLAYADGLRHCAADVKVVLEAAAPAGTPTGGFVTGFERVLGERDGLKAALTSGLELVESAFAHVSHGGPTRADAEKWIAVAREALGERI